MFFSIFFFLFYFLKVQHFDLLFVTFICRLAFFLDIFADFRPSILKHWYRFTLYQTHVTVSSQSMLISWLVLKLVFTGLRVELWLIQSCTWAMVLSYSTSRSGTKSLWPTWTFLVTQTASLSILSQQNLAALTTLSLLLRVPACTMLVGFHFSCRRMLGLTGSETMSVISDDLFGTCPS